MKRSPDKRAYIDYGYARRKVHEAKERLIADKYAKKIGTLKNVQNTLHCDKLMLELAIKEAWEKRKCIRVYTTKYSELKFDYSLPAHEALTLMTLGNKVCEYLNVDGRIGRVAYLGGTYYQAVFDSNMEVTSKPVEIDSDVILRIPRWRVVGEKFE